MTLVARALTKDLGPHPARRRRRGRDGRRNGPGRRPIFREDEEVSDAVRDDGPFRAGGVDEIDDGAVHTAPIGHRPDDRAADGEGAGFSFAMARRARLSRAMQRPRWPRLRLAAEL